jgi:hypothetical protein
MGITRAQALKGIAAGMSCVGCGIWAQGSNTRMTNPRLYSFAGGDQGSWAVTGQRPVMGGDFLAPVSRLRVVQGELMGSEQAKWVLRGVTSNERYITRGEKEALAAKQVAIGRPEATYGALIPIRKNAKWWAMTQDERRAVLEEQSHHVAKGLKYLPAIARRLHHCRDLANPGGFDFLTFFDYRKEDENAFEDLVAALRQTEEWKYVDLEVDVRLVRDGQAR